MKFTEFAEKIKEVYNGKFAHSTCNVQPYVMLGKYIYINCMLAENLHEVANGISANDMFAITLCVGVPNDFNFDKDELPENLIMEALSNRYIVKSADRYLYCDYKKVPYRKTKGNAEKLIITFGKFVDKLYTQVKDDFHNDIIHKDYAMLVKRKITK